MKSVYFISLILFSHTIACSQDTEKKQILPGQRPVNTGTIVTISQKTIAPAPVKTDGANLTPEQQGYTKQVINGKEVYVKEHGQMIFHYEPKK